MKRSRRYRPWLCLFLSASLLILPLLGIWRGSDGLMAAETRLPPADDLTLRGFGQPPAPVKDGAKSEDLLQLGKNLRVPVEVIEKGAPPRWVYVELSTTPIPEPGIPLLLLPAAALLLIRRRAARR